MKMIHKNLTTNQKNKLLEFYEEIIQDCLTFGRIYHFQKKKLKKLGFKTI